MIARVAWCAAVLAGCASAQKLTLREVVASVERHYPPLLAALAEALTRQPAETAGNHPHL